MVYTDEGRDRCGIARKLNIYAEQRIVDRQQRAGGLAICNGRNFRMFKEPESRRLE